VLLAVIAFFRAPKAPQSPREELVSPAPAQQYLAQNQSSSSQSSGGGPLKHIVVAVQRSGTHMMRGFLSSSPFLESYAELPFLSETPALRAALDACPDLGSFDELIAQARLGMELTALRLYACLQAPGLGFQVKYNQVRWLQSEDSLDRLIAAAGIPEGEKINLIHVVRRNVFDVALSRVLLTTTTEGASELESEDVPTADALWKARYHMNQTVPLDKVREVAEATRRDQREWHRSLKKFSRVNVLTVFYNDLTPTDKGGQNITHMPAAEAKRLLTFLNVPQPHPPLVTQYQKQHSQRDYIANWPDLAMLCREILSEPTTPEFALDPDTNCAP